MFEKLTIWLTKQQRKDPNLSFSVDIAEATQFKALVEKTKCPVCSQMKLKAETFVRTPDGWQSMIKCENCPMTCKANSEGFEFKGLDKPGKAVK